MNDRTVADVVAVERDNQRKRYYGDDGDDDVDDSDGDDGADDAGDNDDYDWRVFALCPRRSNAEAIIYSRNSCIYI